jgi:hypothetical protein
MTKPLRAAKSSCRVHQLDVMETKPWVILKNAVTHLLDPTPSEDDKDLATYLQEGEIDPFYIGDAVERRSVRRRLAERRCRHRHKEALALSQVVSGHSDDGEE